MLPVNLLCGVFAQMSADWHNPQCLLFIVYKYEWESDKLLEGLWGGNSLSVLLSLENMAGECIAASSSNSPTLQGKPLHLRALHCSRIRLQCGEAVCLQSMASRIIPLAGKAYDSQEKLCLGFGPVPNLKSVEAHRNEEQGNDEKNRSNWHFETELNDKHKMQRVYLLLKLFVLFKQSGKSRLRERIEHELEYTERLN